MRARPTLPGLRVGRVVFDRAWDMVGVVDAFDGPFARLSRPTGYAWRVRRASLRPGTDYEQVRAIGALHRQRHKGIAG